MKDGFAWYEKVLTRAGFAALVCIGAATIFLHNQFAAAGYLLFVTIGGLLVMYDSLCVYCPYPYKYGDCLFFPHQLVSQLTQMRTGELPWPRHLLTALVFAGLVLIPQYWLWGHWLLFAVFWSLVVAAGLVFSLHFCRRCRHNRCPAKRATLQS
jgi:hypothetical protein